MLGEPRELKTQPVRLGYCGNWEEEGREIRLEEWQELFSAGSYLPVTLSVFTIPSTPPNAESTLCTQGMCLPSSLIVHSLDQ